MTKLIKNNQVVEDSWRLISDKNITSVTDLAQSEHIIVPLKVWKSCHEQLSQKTTIGVWLDSDEPPTLLADDLPNLPLVAINFPVFSDGRGFSYADTLRRQYQFEGELRAIGDVLRDQLFFMKRCGFDSFVLRENDTAEEAMASLQDFQHAYQGTADNSEPLYRHR